MPDTKLLQSILDKVSSVDQKVDEGFKNTNKHIGEVEKKLTKRIDTLGLQLARLEDDAPTTEEFYKLGKRVSKLETQVSKN